MKSITCIFVNYNTSLQSIRCVESIFNNLNESLSIKIVIVDNNSCPKEQCILKEHMEKISYNDHVELIFHEKNIGYFPAISHAYVSNKEYIEKCDYVIIGNNDLVFDKSFFPNLEQNVYHNDIYVVSPNIINEDNNHQNPQILFKYSKLQLLFLDLYHSSYFMASLLYAISKYIKFRGSQKNKEGYDISQYISIGYGACYVLTQYYINKVGFIPSYLFLMNEENSLTDVVLKNNGRIYYDANLVVHHMEHSTINVIPKKHIYKLSQESYKISKHHFNNKYLFDKQLNNK